MASQEGINQDQTVEPGIDQKLRTRNIAETLASLEQCSSLYNAVRQADAEYLLRRSGLHTLLAPQNSALNDVPADAVEEFLMQHLLPGGIESFDLRRCQTVKTAAGKTLNVTPADGSFRIGQAKIVRSDIPCTNGVIQIIDGVLTS